jgi:chromate transporter
MAEPAPVTERVPLATIAGQWARMGITGFGGPPAHIVLLRALCVDNRKWLSASEFEDGIAATTLLPGPASTQLAIFCAWKLRGPAGAVLGGVCFIVPGLIIILGLSVLFLAGSPPLWVQGAAAGAGAAGGASSFAFASSGTSILVLPTSLMSIVVVRSISIGLPLPKSIEPVTCVAILESDPSEPIVKA